MRFISEIVTANLGELLLVDGLEAFWFDLAQIVGDNNSDAVLWIDIENPHAPASQFSKVAGQFLRKLDELMYNEHCYTALLMLGDSWAVNVVTLLIPALVGLTPVSCAPYRTHIHTMSPVTPVISSRFTQPKAK